MDLALACIDEARAMELAILFHDVICEAGATDNEQRSANLFEQLAGGKSDRELTTKVINMILSTKDNKFPRNNDEKLICDIDLSSFALP